MRAIINKDLENAYGTFKKGSECKVLKAWVNSINNDIYCEIEFWNEINMITTVRFLDYKVKF